MSEAPLPSSRKRAAPQRLDPTAKGIEQLKDKVILAEKVSRSLTVLRLNNLSYFFAPELTRQKISRLHSKITDNRSLNSHKILFCDSLSFRPKLPTDFPNIGRNRSEQVGTPGRNGFSQKLLGLFRLFRLFRLKIEKFISKLFF